MKSSLVGWMIVLPLAVGWVFAADAPRAKPATTQSAGDGWRVLFDGKDLSAWTSVGSAVWRVADGVIAGGQDGDPRKSGLLMTKDQFKDFELELEFMIDEHVVLDAPHGVADRRPPLQVLAVEKRSPRLGGRLRGAAGGSVFGRSRGKQQQQGRDDAEHARSLAERPPRLKRSNRRRCP